MIYRIILLVLVIINLGWMSFLAFKGEKNALMVFAILEVILAILFALTF